jgi:predicted acylesterase/phospholipase RssA
VDDRTADLGLTPIEDDRRLCSTLEAEVRRGDLVASAAAFDAAGDSARSSLVRRAEKLVADFERLIRIPDDHVDPQRREALLTAARRATPRAALMLSGGGRLGNYHFGVLKSLLRHGLLPRVISGASAGAYAAAVAATRTDRDLAALLSSDALAAKAGAGTAQDRGLRLDGSSLQRKIAETIPDLTFAEALAVSGRRLNVVVTSARDATPLMLNPLTTPDVLIRGAVLASCAVPGHFPAIGLLQRPKGGPVQPFLPDQRWLDGSLSADLPAAQLEDLYGAGVTVASMVNPVILPWLRDPHSENGLLDEAARVSARATKTYVQAMAGMVSTLTRSAPGLDFMVRCWSNVAAQTYAADINLMPRRRLHDPLRLLDEADRDALRAFIAEGELITEQRLAMLKACTLLDRTLDRLTGDADPT